MIEGVHRQTNNNPINAVGYGYIVLPYNVNRSEYIETAYRKEKVSILADQGSGYIYDCYITRSALREIVWPEDENGLGSAVVYVTNYFNNKPFVIGVLSKEDQSILSEEYGITFEKIYKNNKSSISLNAERGEGIITINNVLDAAALIINCIGLTGTKIDLNTNGQLNIKADQNVMVRSIEELLLKSTNARETEISTLLIKNSSIKAVVGNDTTMTMDKNNVNIDPSNIFSVGSGSEPLVLGDELQSQLNITNTYLSALQAATQSALAAIDSVAFSTGATVFSSAMSGSNPGSYSNIKSQTSYTD